MAAGALSAGDLVRALALQAREETRLGEILLSKRMVSESALSDALCAQWKARPIELGALVPDPRLVGAFGAERCLELGTVPLSRKGTATLVATGRPEQFAQIRPELEATFGKIMMVLAPEREVAAAIARAAGPDLAKEAEKRTPASLSCRVWRPKKAAWLLGIALGLTLAAALAAPIATLSALTLFCMATLAATAVLKGLALGQALRRRPESPVPDLGAIARSDTIRLPVISMLIPLLREEDIAASLVRRLGRLRYPRELMDLILLVEEDDLTTRAALARARLPSHMRVLIVPPGTVETKPRALNYGLSFARGRIVGIWDAEDAPERDQLHRVAAHFARADPRVACLQGALDFYNRRTNWLSRCFTLEYATWFRAVLPGLQSLDLPLPLGGTTLFFRRSVLDEIGGWDAHNVTEDADLGIRLYRAGYRTEIVDTVTQEEANCRLVPWIRQRSRWLKGYAMTYVVHMRAPAQLWRDMGARGFIGFQTLFVGTLTQFLLSPLLLSLWLLTFTQMHPLEGYLPIWLGWFYLALVLASEAISMGLTICACRGRDRARLLWWLPTLPAYFPLASLAAYKGLWEMLSRPFFWDKTQHGVYTEDASDRTAAPQADAPGVQVPQRAPAFPGRAARLRRHQMRAPDR
ncbi:MAG: glycosyltransferase family 2 protein [Pseudomonadota bacterium]